jgi:hypothetical protein
MSDLLQGSYGGQRIFFANVRRQVGRDLVPHKPSQGTGYVVQDRGDELGAIDFTLCFCPVAGEEHFRTRYDRFLALKAQGPQILVHPIQGSLRAQVGSTSEEIDGPEMIILTGQFLPVDPPVTVTAPGGGTSPIAGVEAVTLQAEDLRDELEFSDIGIGSTIPDDAIAAATSWADADAPDARDVLLEHASQASAIDALVEDNGMTDDLDLWPAFRSAMLLRDALRGAAAAATQAAEQLVEVVVQSPTPLRMFLARLCGADKVDAIIEEVGRVNDFGAWALVPAGTRLKLNARWIAG